MTDAITLDVPVDMASDVAAIFDGEYNVDHEFATPPRVLDIGGNVGGYSAWVVLRYPGATVTAYEPNPAVLPFLRKNAPHATIVEAAVTGTMPGFVTFYEGASCSGQAGLAQLPDGPVSIRGDGFQVATVPPSSLPRAEVVKIDTEGSELQILDRYDLSETVVVVLEWHRVEDRIAIDMLLRESGFVLVGGVTRAKWLGTQKWVRETAT